MNSSKKTEGKPSNGFFRDGKGYWWVLCGNKNFPTSVRGGKDGSMPGEKTKGLPPIGDEAWERWQADMRMIKDIEMNDPAVL